MAMRQADATYVFLDYNIYKRTSIPGNIKVHWRYNASLLVTHLDDAIDPVTLLLPRWGETTSMTKPVLDPIKDTFTNSLLAVYAQVRWQLYRHGSDDHESGGGTFHVTSKGLAFLDFDPRTDGADLTVVWSHQI